jgi:CHAT domain-containing protein
VGLIHIAAHAEVSSDLLDGARIYIKADDANDGRLNIDEIYKVDARGTGLIVLSACRTNIGWSSRGDEIRNFTRAFLYAGAKSVITSLWNVDDDTTFEMMNEFYSALQSGVSKVRALAKAQSAMRKKHSNPYYWAGFVLAENQCEPAGSTWSGPHAADLADSSVDVQIRGLSTPPESCCGTSGICRALVHYETERWH